MPTYNYDPGGNNNYSDAGRRQIPEDISDLDLSKYYTRGTRKSALEKYLVDKKISTPDYYKHYDDSQDTFLNRTGHWAGLKQQFADVWNKPNGYSPMLQARKTLYNNAFASQYEPWKLNQKNDALVSGNKGDIEGTGNKYWDQYKAERPQYQNRSGGRNAAYTSFLRGSVY